MQLLTLVLTTLLSAIALLSLTTASPIADPAAVKRSEDIVVFEFSFICPNNETTWKIGKKELVQWNSTTFPSGIRATNVSFLLGYNNGTVVEDNITIATDIPVAINETSIVVPNVTPGTSYVVSVSGLAIFGKSQNFIVTVRD